MMKKVIILGTLISGIVFGGAVGALAASNLEEIRVYLNRELSFEINGETWTPAEANGASAPPITYNGTTYLPLRALANALDVPVDYDASRNKVMVGRMLDGVGHDSALVPATYSDLLLKSMQHTFFFTPHIPNQLVQGDEFVRSGCSSDTCTIMFKHLLIGEAPRDYSGPDQIEKHVTLSNGTQAVWLKQGNLSFKMNDVYINVSSRDNSLSDSQIEQIAASFYQSPLKPTAESAAASLEWSSFIGEYTRFGSNNYIASAVQIKHIDGNKLVFDLDAFYASGEEALQKGGVNIGSIHDGTAIINGDTAVYGSEGPFTLTFRFFPDSTFVVEQEGPSEFGHNVTADGFYSK